MPSDRLFFEILRKPVFGRYIRRIGRGIEKNGVDRTCGRHPFQCCNEAIGSYDKQA